MAVSDGIYYLLTNNAGVSAITTTIQPAGGVKPTTFPCVIYHIGTATATYSAKGDTGLPMSRFQFDCYSTVSRQEAMTLALAIRDALKNVVDQTLHDGTHVYVCKCDPPVDLTMIAAGQSGTGTDFRVMVEVEVWYLG